MKTDYLLVLLFAALLICPVAAEPNERVPALLPETMEDPLGNATETLPEPVISISTATPTELPISFSTVPTPLLPATPALPPHEQESVFSLPQDHGIPDISGFDAAPSDNNAVMQVSYESPCDYKKYHCKGQVDLTGETEINCRRPLTNGCFYITDKCITTCSNNVCWYTPGYTGTYLQQYDRCVSTFGYAWDLYYPKYINSCSGASWYEDSQLWIRSPWVE